MNAGLLNSKFSSLLLVAAVWLGSVTSCTEEREHTAPAIHDRDSVAMMTSYGVNTLISDSGVIKYRIWLNVGKSMTNATLRDGYLTKACC